MDRILAPLTSHVLQTGAVVGLLALVVVFQPELRRALERIGRVGSLGWLWSGSHGEVQRVATEVSHAAALLSAERSGALIVLERETGLEDAAETGVMLHADLSAELLRTVFAPRAALHDGAVLIRGAEIVAAGIVLPLAETTLQRERLRTALVSLLQPGGTRGRGVFTLPAPGERGARALRLVRRRGPGRHQPTATAPAPAPRPAAVDGGKHG